jgi:hypothetical protein
MSAAVSKLFFVLMIATGGVLITGERAAANGGCAGNNVACRDFCGRGGGGCCPNSCTCGGCGGGICCNCDCCCT